jgi:hypothetical protein
LFSVLYSDVGARFYARCGTGEDTEDGWKVTDPVSTIWFVRDAERGEESADGGLTSHHGGYDWADLDLATARYVWEADAKLITKELSSSSQYSPHLSGRHLVAFLPNEGVAQTMCLRTFDFSAGGNREPESPWNTWGVRLVTSDEAAESEREVTPVTFATWSLDIGVTPSTLIITRLRATKETVVPLLKKVSQFAKSQKLERVEVWNLDGEFSVLANEHFRARTFVRDEHLSALKWYGDKDGKDVKWCFNEK